MQSIQQEFAEKLIQKFAYIPDDQWCNGCISKVGPDGQVQYCALGHCGVRENMEPIDWPNEALVLVDILGYRAEVINDGLYPWTTAYGETPKQRILNALREVVGGSK